MYEKYQIKSTFSRKYWVSVGVGVFESTPLLRIGPFECFVHILGGPGTTAHCTALETFEPGKITPSKNIFSLLMIIKYAWLKRLKGGCVFNKKLIGMHFELFLFGPLQRKCTLLPSQKKTQLICTCILNFKTFGGYNWS